MLKKVLPALLFFTAVCIVLFAQDAMTILSENGNVGIGTETPTEKLEVAGNARVNGEIQAEYHGEVRNIMPYLAPIGTILPFAGQHDKIPAGWILCDGRELTIDDYQDLYDVIGRSWGFGGTTFRVPDLRGQFLRGVDHEAGVDPDVADRHNLYNGGVTGNQAGSYQTDAFQGHYHRVTNDAPHRGGGSADSGGLSRPRGSATVTVWEPTSDGTNGIPRTSSETRARNAYVNFIIKY